MAVFYFTLFAANDEYAFRRCGGEAVSAAQYIMGLSPDMMAKWEADALREDPENGEAIFLDELKQVMTAVMTGLFDVAAGDGTAYSVKFNRTKCPWPALSTPAPKGKGKPKAKWYYAPKDGLDNITLYELAYTFTLYENYVSERDEAQADMLIAALYRPSRPETQEERDSAWHGDRRQPLRRYEDKVEQRAKMVATLPVLTRRLIVFWFAGCREAIVKAYPKVFKRADQGDAGHGYGWGGLLLQLAETGTFGELGTTSDQHYSNALTFLSMKDDERVEMERKLNKKS